MDIISKNLLNNKKKNFHLEYYSFRKNFNFDKKILNKEQFIREIQIIVKNLNINYKKDEKFILALENSLEMILILFTLILLGKKIIIINPDEINTVKKKIIQNNPDAKIISKVNKIEFYQFKKRIILLNELKKKNSTHGINLQKYLKKINYENLSISYCSSGTTSFPKLIKLNKTNIISQLKQINQRLKIKNLKNKFFTAMPCTHISAFFFIFLNGVIFDKKVIFLNYFNILKFKKILLNEKLSLVYLNPTMIEILNKYMVKSNNLMKTIVLSGSAPLPKISLKKFLTFTNCKFIHLYGLTETTNTACATPLNKSKSFYKRIYFEEKVPSVGYPLKGCKVEILKNNKIVKKEKKEGEIIVSGPNVIDKQKLKNLNSFFFRSKYLKTGDVGFFKYYNKKKFIFITGRKKEMIIKNGINIYLNEIDNYLKSKNFMSVFSIKIPSLISGEDYALVTDSLKEFKRNFSNIIKILPNYMQTNQIILVKKLLKTLSGKLKKNLIADEIKKTNSSIILKKKFI